MWTKSGVCSGKQREQKPSKNTSNCKWILASIIIVHTEQWLLFIQETLRGKLLYVTSVIIYCQYTIFVENTLPEQCSYQEEIRNDQEILSFFEAVWVISTVYCINILWKVCTDSQDWCQSKRYHLQKGNLERVILIHNCPSSSDWGWESKIIFSGFVLETVEPYFSGFYHF